MEQYPGLHKLHLIHAVLLGWIFVIKGDSGKGISAPGHKNQYKPRKSAIYPLRLFMFIMFMFILNSTMDNGVDMYIMEC